MKSDSEKIRRKRKRRVKKSNRCYKRLLATYGQEVADDYKAVAHINPIHSKQRIFDLKISQFEKQHGFKPTDKIMTRIELLNKITGQTLLTIGWKCQGCGIPHESSKFFEVDHIIPTSEGGSNRTFNLQLLCPNCHKKKTLQLDGICKHHDFKSCSK